MEPQIQSRLATYFRTFNAGDEAGHKALWGSEMVYFGSSLRTTVQGRGSLQGVWKAIREGVGVRTITPICFFGNTPELAALVRFAGEGGEPTGEAAMVFQFDAFDLIKRIGVHWDPGTFLKTKEYPGRTFPVRERLADKDPRVQTTLEAYFRTFNASDEAGHAAVFHPDLVFFGSLSGMQSQGRASALGIFRSAHHSLGITRISPKRVFGDWPELSVLAELSQAEGRGAIDVMVVFQCDDEGMIRRLSILWDPLPFLRATGQV